MSAGWTFHNPVRILFGSGRLCELPLLAGGGTILLVTTPGFTRRGVTGRILEYLGEGRTVVFDSVQPNPDLSCLESAIASLQTSAVERIVAFGGGSAIDTAKALSAALPDPAFSLRRHLEHGAPLSQKPLIPVISVPTTAGTGSEVTPFGTIWDSAHRRKHSLASPRLFPEAALLDPETTIGLPRHVTIATGLDALSQALESVWNRAASPVTIALAARAGLLAMDALPRVVAEPEDLEARTAMMEASLLSGLAISQTRTALAHSISYPITARFGVPHGLACGFALPEILEFNAEADDGRLQKLAETLGCADPRALSLRLDDLLSELGIAEAVRGYVSELDVLLAHSGEMLTPGRAGNNLRSADEQCVVGILTRTWERRMRHANSTMG